MRPEKKDPQPINRFLKRFENRPWITKPVMLFLYKSKFLEWSFYVSAYRWHKKNKKPDKLTIMDLYNFFYLSFLKIPPDKIEIVEKSDKTIFTRCFHDCPLLNTARLLGKDTREFCRSISKKPCEYFIRKFNMNIVVDNEYQDIRPHLPKCEETLTIVD